MYPKLEVKMAGASLLDSEGEERLTALHLTAQHGQVAACRWLLQQRADAAAVTKKRLGFGKTRDA